MGVWDRRWDDGCLGLIMGPQHRLDHGDGWEKTGGKGACLAPRLLSALCLLGTATPGVYRLGPAVWDHGCLGPTVWDHGCVSGTSCLMGVWFGTMFGIIGVGNISVWDLIWDPG